MQRIVIAIAGLALAGAAQADILTNGSFETGRFVDNTGQDTDNLPTAGDTSMDGWTVTGTGLAWEGPNTPFTITASDGGYNLDLTGYRDASPYGGVSQSFATVLGHTYSLQYDVGNSGRYNGAGGATVDAYINGVDIYSFNNSSLNPTNSQASYWLTGSTSFVATGSSTTLQLLGAVGGAFIGLDNVRVADLTPTAPTSGVPEPASWAMFIGGFGLVGGAMRRRAPKVSFA